MLCREIIAVYYRIYTKHINEVCGQNVESAVHIVTTGQQKVKSVTKNNPVNT
jgi:hypothetical protein